MNRRKTKTEREIVADAKKTTMNFCSKQGQCRNCPLNQIKRDYNVGCVVAYLIYLMEVDYED